MTFRAPFLVLLAAVLTLCLSTHRLSAADVSIAGTWELNVAKSTSTTPLPKAQSRTYETAGQQEKMTMSGTDGQGKPMSASFTATLDGKDYPYSGGPFDSIALTVVDATTNKFVAKKGGAVVLSGVRVISADGRTMTLDGKGTNPAGQPVESKLVFDKK
jgi:hypothetical protein